MELPFTERQFFDVFVRYNESLGLLPFVIWGGGAVLAGFFFWLRPIRNAWIVWFLDAIWLINAVGYHLGSFWVINPAAPGFAGLFFLEAIAFGTAAVTAKDDLFPQRGWVHYALSLSCVVFSLILYPVWMTLIGRGYPSMPVFGVAPCPTTIFTIGILIMMRSPHREWLFVLPLIWAVVGGSAAISLGVPPDYFLWVAGLAGFVVLMTDRLAYSEPRAP